MEQKIIDFINEILKERGITHQDYYLLEEEKEELKQIISNGVLGV
ncbi:hypothetical protein OSJ97_24130 [Escherichia coli]|nr:hypothetical protein [Escherichia coli]